MTDIVTDTFERAASTNLGNAETGQAWTERVGDWQLTGTGQVETAAIALRGHATVDAGEADCEVEVDIATLAADGNGGLVFRWSDTSNYLMLFIQGIANEIYLQKRVAGVDSTIGGPYSPIIKAARDTLKVIANGSMLRVYQNDWLLGTVTETHNQTATNHGVWANNNTDWEIEAFYVRELEATETTLKFEFGPDDVATGGASHRTAVELQIDGVDLARIPSFQESGNDGVREWREAEVDLTRHVPAVVAYEITFNRHLAGVDPYWDTTHIRRVRLTSPTTDYGRDWQDREYDAGDQDGYAATAGQMGTDNGVDVTSQLNPETQELEDTGDGLLHWNFGGVPTETGLWSVGIWGEGT